MTKSEWWYSASQAQKLAQIDGGLECGMTATQVAMVSGTVSGTVQGFAQKHDRSFPVNTGKYVAAGHKTRRGNHASKAAYLRGDAVDFWQEPASTNTVEFEEIRF